MEFKIILVTILTRLYLISCTNVEESTYKAKNGLECNKCPPGTYWEADCTGDDRGSICRNCPRGSYSETENIAEYCEKCLKKGHCAHGTVFVNACSSTTNNRCECPNGQYWVHIDGYDGSCYKHRTCNDDEVVVKRGTSSEDTECGPKPSDENCGDQKELLVPPTYREDKKDSDDKHIPGTDGDVNHDLLPTDNGLAIGGSGMFIMLIPIILLLVCVFYPRLIRRIILVLFSGGDVALVNIYQH